MVKHHVFLIMLIIGLTPYTTMADVSATKQITATGDDFLYCPEEEKIRFTRPDPKGRIQFYGPDNLNNTWRSEPKSYDIFPNKTTFRSIIYSSTLFEIQCTYDNGVSFFILNSAISHGSTPDLPTKYKPSGPNWIHGDNDQRCLKTSVYDCPLEKKG